MWLLFQTRKWKKTQSAKLENNKKLNIYTDKNPDICYQDFFLNTTMSVPNRLAVKLKNIAEVNVKKGHPWIFSNSIERINKDGKAGDIAILFDQRRNKPFAIGLYDPYSPIRIKVIHHQGPAKIDSLFFENKIQKAFLHRKPLLEKDVNAYRLLFGENDGMPGLIVDIYNKVGVIKVYSAIWLPYLEMLLAPIVKASEVDSLIIRWNRKLQTLDNLPHKEGDVIYGDLSSSLVTFTEYGVHFETDIILGHKTGFFLDHRENRHKIGQMAKGKTVLDVFSYTGGFSTHALAGGATEVTSLDISKQALELAEHNASLNAHSGIHETITGDAFEELARLMHQKKKYDIVIIDPPSFAKNEKEIYVAKKKYAQLAEIGVALTRNGGTLLLASCSSRITQAEFLQIHSEVFKNLKTNHTLLETTTHAIDHPIGFEEGAYLKSAYYKIR